MGFLDELKKMTRPYDDDDEFFDDEDEAIPVAEEPAPARPAQARPAQARPAAARRPAPAPKRSAFVHDEPSESERPAPSYAPRGDSRAAAKVVHLNNGGGQLKVVVAAPKQFEAASEIAEHLRDRRAVLLNLEKTDPASPTRRTARSAAWPARRISSRHSMSTSWATSSTIWSRASFTCKSGHTVSDSAYRVVHL